MTDCFYYFFNAYLSPLPNFGEVFFLLISQVLFAYHIWPIFLILFLNSSYTFKKLLWRIVQFLCTSLSLWFCFLAKTRLNSVLSYLSCFTTLANLPVVWNTDFVFIHTASGVKQSQAKKFYSNNTGCILGN